MGDTVSAKKGQNHFKIQHTRNSRYASTAFFRIIHFLFYWEYIMSFKPIIELAKLQRENRVVTMMDGKKILLIWNKEQVHAIESQCPHLKLSLTKGTITEENSIVCPFHKSEFDLTNGQAKCWSPWPPLVGSLLAKVSKKKNLKIYPTQIENGQVLVKIDS
jgi:nitrite reductase/ring-hydroxylating ferredoxin subunit